MLVLSRQKNERIVIEDEHGNLLGTVTVVDLQRGRVRLGFEFPTTHKIHREDKELVQA